MMKTQIDHLPARKQRELNRILEILHAEFNDALALGTSNWKKQGRILRIVLFGSYARGTWVEDRISGYRSDFDILIVVNHEKLTDVVDFWNTAEDRIIRDEGIKTPVNFIVHTLEEVNSALSEAQYFFSDIVTQGIELYNLKIGKDFIAPAVLTPKDALEVAEKYYKNGMSRAKSALALNAAAIDMKEWNDAAFMLHQAAERLYGCFLLVHTNYLPSTHNIKFLRSLCESRDERLVAAWPRATKAQSSKFELLKRAYVEARYSEHYSISAEQLNWLAERVEQLADLVQLSCEEYLNSLKD